MMRKLQNHASSTVKVTEIRCLNQLPYRYKTVEDIMNDNKIFEIKGV